MALSGLGCHHKSCAPVAAASYASCYSGCYGGCYGSTQAYAAPVADSIAVIGALLTPADPAEITRRTREFLGLL